MEVRKLTHWPLGDVIVQKKEKEKEDVIVQKCNGIRPLPEPVLAQIYVTIGCHWAAVS